MALPSGTDLYYVGPNSSGGMTFGADTTELISFYGVTPVAQLASAAQTTTAATWVTVCATKAAFASSDDATTFINAMKQVQYVMKTLGLWKGTA